MKFKFKVFTSFVLTITFLVASLSGLAMYLAPKGRIATWIEWTWLSFTKEEWAVIHTVFVTVFLIGGLLHLFYFNWKVFWAYIKQKAKRGVRYRWELAVSAALGLVLWFGTVHEVKPVISVVLLAEAIDESFETRSNEPPVPHAEELTIAEFAESVLQRPAGEALQLLDENGYPPIGQDETIAGLSERHEVSPSALFEVLASLEKPASEVTGFSGYGQKSLVQTCADLDIRLADARQALKGAGIDDADPDETLKNVADRHGKKPSGLVTIIAGEE